MGKSKGMIFTDHRNNKFKAITNAKNKCRVCFKRYGVLFFENVLNPKKKICMCQKCNQELFVNLDYKEKIAILEDALRIFNREKLSLFYCIKVARGWYKLEEAQAYAFFAKKEKRIEGMEIRKQNQKLRQRENRKNRLKSKTRKL